MLFSNVCVFNTSIVANIKNFFKIYNLLLFNIFYYFYKYFELVNIEFMLVTLRLISFYLRVNNLS